MKIKYVHQKDDYGCAVACITMITGIAYDTVAGSFQANFKREGVSTDKVRDYILEHGFSAIDVIPSNYKNVPKINARLSKPFADVHIVTVQSFADSELNHALVMDKRGRIYDPDNPLRKDLSPYYCIVRVTGFWDDRKSRK